MSDEKETEQIIELTNVIEEKTEKVPVFPDFQSEVKGMRAALQAEAEKWMALEGAKILEQVAREIFPRIAAEIIREEIEKLKAASEEQK